MNNIEEINLKIIAKWENRLGNNPTPFYPSIFHNLKFDCDVLFVGLNPSAPEFQELPSLGNKALVEELIRREQRMIHGEGENREGQYKRYFSIFNKIEKSCNIAWEHIDLIHLRYTEQKGIEKHFKEHPEDLEFEMDVFDAALRLFKAKVVFVNNSYASKCIRERYRDMITDDSLNQWSRVLVGENEKIFIFEGMLQRQQPLTHDERVNIQKHRLLKALSLN